MQTLKRILTNAKPCPLTLEPKMKKFRLTSCNTCPHLLEVSEFQFKQGEGCTIKFICASHIIIYAITCPGCGDQYVGETGLSLYPGTSLHKEKTSHLQYRQLYFSENIGSCPRKLEFKFRNFPLYKCSHNTTIQK